MGKADNPSVAAGAAPPPFTQGRHAAVAANYPPEGNEREGVQVYLPDIIGGGYGEFWRCRKRYRVVKGGKASKKSTTTALWYIYHLMKYPGANLLVVRHVARTHRDSTFAQLKWAIDRMHAHRWWKITSNPMEMTCKLNGNKILFRGMDNADKLASTTVENGYLCWVWLEEAYEIIHKSDFDKMDYSAPRGEVPPHLWKQTTITFNPWNEGHWLKGEFFDKPRDDALVMTTNHTCNEFLDETDRAMYRRMEKENPRKYAVIGLGEWGIAEGLVFDNWTVSTFDIRQVTKEKDWQWRHIFGLDYGYTNDPTAFIAAAVNPVDKVIYIYDEHYERKMLNDAIATMIIRKGYSKERIRADAAEPKSNDDLRRSGIGRLLAATKGPDSLMNGIARLQEYKIIVHRNCVNTAGELATYCWQTDKAGNPLNRPEDKDNHLMDALRYAMEDVVGFNPGEEPPRRPPRSYTGLTAEDVRGGWQ